MEPEGVDVMLGGFVAVSVFAYALAARRLASSPISGAMIFTVLGVVAGSQVLDLTDDADVAHLLESFLEITLLLVLFADAFSVRHWNPRKDGSTALRLLTIGMPLTIIAGWVVAMPLFPTLDVWEAAIIGTILAPTDAALGLAVVSDRGVPRRVRQALNVESGLNDGLALPFLGIFIVFALEAAGSTEVGVLERFLRAIVISGAIGGLAGWGASWLILLASDRRWISEPWIRIALLAVAVVAFVASDQVDGSGFIGTWVAGFVAGRTIGGRLEEPTAFVEEAGSLLTLIAFLTFGALMVTPVLDDLRWALGLYALVSLTAIRMVPVAVALIGSRLRPPTVAFAGWFGPRGLASLVFVLLVSHEALPGGSTIVDVVTVTVLASVFLHGLSAAPGVRRYAAWFTRASAEDPAMAEALETGEPVPRRRLLAPETTEVS